MADQSPRPTIPAATNAGRIQRWRRHRFAFLVNTAAGLVGVVYPLYVGNGWQWTAALLLFVNGVGTGACIERVFGDARRLAPAKAEG